MEEVVIAQSYTERDTDKVMPDPEFYRRYVPIVTEEEFRKKFPLVQTMMETLGHPRWRLVLLMYEQVDQYEDVVPLVRTFHGGQFGVDHDALGLVPDRFGKISPLRIREDAARRVRKIREMMLKELTRGPQFGFLVSYRFPAHMWRTKGRVVWNRVFSPKLYDIMHFLFRAVADIPEFCLRSSDPKLANAATLAEMIL